MKMKMKLEQSVILYAAPRLRELYREVGIIEGSEFSLWEEKRK